MTTSIEREEKLLSILGQLGIQIKQADEENERLIALLGEERSISDSMAVRVNELEAELADAKIAVQAAQSCATHFSNLLSSITNNEKL